MSERTPVQEVFANVEPDPDAILEAADADSPTELVSGGGRHDPVEDDVDESTVADLFWNLKEAAAETTDATGTGEGNDDQGRDGDRGRDADRNTTADSRGDPSTAPETGPADASAGMEVTFGEPSVTVLPGDGAAIDELLGEERPATPEESEPDMELAGGEPTVTRVASDAFGRT